MIVDFQHHFTPPELTRLGIVKAMAINRAGPTPPYRMPAELTDLDAQLRDMDRAGIDHAVLSCGLGMDGTTVEICRLLNEAMFRACERHPARFTSVAHTDPLDGKAGLEELRRCRKEFGMPAVVITSEPSGLPLDAPELEPFWSECERLGMYVFVHPALRPSVGEHLDRYDLVRSLGREYSLATATARLIYGGVLDRNPGLRVQMGHLAGGLAVSLERLRVVHDRVRMGTAGDPLHGTLPQRDLDHYLRERLFFDTAGIFGSMTAVRAAAAEFTAQRIVFGTDYPLEINGAEELTAFVSSLKAFGAEGDAILSGNAGNLLAPGTSVEARDCGTAGAQER